ncbi:MAG: PUP1 family protein [Actinomycetota bacterium]|nr:PUP1 family protein [Actinomycetota bacterium]
MGSERRRWLNPAQPQTLQIACWLLYINAAFLLLDMVRLSVFDLIYVILLGGQIAAGSGIANERKWGYGLGIAMAFLPFLYRFYKLGNPIEGVGIFTLMFEIALVALLLHPQSRDYQRIWFK